MKKLFLALCVLALLGLAQSAAAGIRVEVPDSTVTGAWARDTLIWASAIDTVSTVHIGNASNLSVTAHGYWNSPVPKLDTSTHYISGLDTVITRHRIECDTTTIEKLVILDTTVIRLDVECDTIYRVEYKPVWEPKIKVFLKPDQLEQLLWLIKHSDEIEMKKTYGQKE